jgi:4-hydroxy-2-oxoheptanedioate aldolase
MAKASSTLRASARNPTRLGRTFKGSLRSGKVLLGGVAIEYLRPSLVKIYKYVGFDFIYIENEHALFQGSDLADFVLSSRDNNIPVIAKVAQLERAEVGRLLEAGVVGIQLPRTESREDLLTLIDYMKFPPHGSRAGAPCFGNVDYVAPANSREWLRLADQSTVVVAHIETAKGYENAEQIITTPRLDMLYVGPYDFSISMGYPGEYDNPKVRKPMQEILKLCQKHGLPFGTTASDASSAAQWMKQGCRFFEIIDELSLITSGAAAIVDQYRRPQKR